MTKARILSGPFPVTVGGLACEVTDVELEAPDHSVGMMGWSITGYHITDLMGNELAVEAEQFEDQLWEQIGDPDEGDVE